MGCQVHLAVFVLHWKPSSINHYPLKIVVGSNTCEHWGADVKSLLTMDSSCYALLLIMVENPLESDGPIQPLLSELFLCHFVYGDLFLRVRD